MDFKRIVYSSAKKQIGELTKLWILSFPRAKKLAIEVDGSAINGNIQSVLDKEIPNPEPTNIVYLVRLTHFQGLAKDILKSCISWKKGHGKEVHLSKRNTENAPKNKEFALYVGSKRAHFSARLKQHIGTPNERTYALHIKDWFPGRSATLEIEYYAFENTVTTSQLQFVEDSLWDYYRPLFGKRGAH